MLIQKIYTFQINTVRKKFNYIQTEKVHFKFKNISQYYCFTYTIAIYRNCFTKHIHHLVNQSHFLGFIWSDAPSCQHYIKGTGKTKLYKTNVQKQSDLSCEESFKRIIPKCDVGILLTILGSLCVPPAPGRRPSMTSGQPRTVFLLLVAILY